MRIVDLTLPIEEQEPAKHGLDDPGTPRRTIETEEWSVPTLDGGYRARIHTFHLWSMSGTYLDLPGHIKETDDGTRANDLPLSRLYRLPASLARFNLPGGAGPVSAAMMEQAVDSTAQSTPALVVNALGRRRFDEIEERSVFLHRDAVEWIIERGYRMIISDVYESKDTPQNVFEPFFAAGVLTVCYPIHLHQLSGNNTTITVLPLRIRGATQLPCRVIAEEES